MILALWLVASGFAQDSDEAAVTERVAVSAAQVDASFVLEVTDKEHARIAMITAASESGGYFSEASDEQVVLRVPPGSVDGLFAKGAELGTVIDRSFQSSDLRSGMADVRARLAVREGMLDRYYEVLAQAEADALIAVERQIVVLVQDMERLTGQLRFMEHQAEYARVVVWFSFTDRGAPTWDGDSSFPWLNSVDLTELVHSSHYGWTSGSRGRVLTVAPPDGFAVYRTKRELRAVSPDSVIFRMRSVKHKPTAELVFWKEALRLRMEAAGYHVLADEEVAVGPHGGAQLLLAAPIGTVDYGFLVTVVPLDHKIVVFEAAGEVSKLEQHRPVIDAAIRSAR